MSKATLTDQIFCMIVSVRMPTQWDVSELKFGFDDRVTLCWTISKLSLRIWLLQGSGFMLTQHLLGVRARSRCVRLGC